MSHHHERPFSRRDFLARAGGGMGMLALLSLLEESARTASAKAPHFKADGEERHLVLPRRRAQPHRPVRPQAGTGQARTASRCPSSFKRPVTAMGRTAYTPLLASKRKFKQHGQSGTWVSDWYPEIATCVDDLAVIRSCYADGLNHVGSVCQMNTGSILGGRPCLGSWALYGLGSDSDNLPGYVVLLDYPEDPPGGSRNWAHRLHAGDVTRARASATARRRSCTCEPPPAEAGAAAARQARFHPGTEPPAPRSTRREDSDLEARIAAYELAYRMQSAAPEAVDLAQETDGDETALRPGRQGDRALRPQLPAGPAAGRARRALRAAVLRLAAASGTPTATSRATTPSTAGRATSPIAGLLKDLKRRGLLDSTLVIWGGEFGRTPMSESGNGRDHNPYGFTMWMAGGGIKGGITYGTTDDIGLYAVENRVHVHDLHATILHCLGLDHRKLTYPAQRPRRARHHQRRQGGQGYTRLAASVRQALRPSLAQRSRLNERTRLMNL